MLLEIVTEDDLRAVIIALMARAKRGDLAAIRELLDRVIGKSGTALDPDRLDVDADRIQADAMSERNRVQNLGNRMRREKPTELEVMLGGMQASFRPTSVFAL